MPTPATHAPHRPRLSSVIGAAFIGSTLIAVMSPAHADPADPAHARSLRYHLGRALEDSGEAPAAREEYERVVAEDASFLDAAERLRGLA